MAIKQHQQQQLMLKNGRHYGFSIRLRPHRVQRIAMRQMTHLMCLDVFNSTFRTWIKRTPFKLIRFRILMLFTEKSMFSVHTTHVHLTIEFSVEFCL